MAKMLRFVLLVLSTVLSSHVFAQTSGVEGVVKDTKGELLMQANIRVEEGGILKGTAVSDIDGNFSVRGLNPGNYDITVSLEGYDSELITGIPLVADQNATVNVQLKKATPRPAGGNAGTTGGSTNSSGGLSGNLGEVRIRATRYVKPIIEVTQPGSRSVLTDKDIEKMAVRDLASQAATTPGVLKAGRGDELNIGGGRGENTLIIIDGIQQPGGSRASNLPPGSVASISVISGGLPARYGDATGGVLNVTTKGVTAKLQGSVGGEQSIDGYNNSRAYFNLSGPIIRRTDSNGYKRPVLGFTLNGDYQYDHDASPSYYKNYVLKQEVLDALRAEPIRAVTGTNGTTYKNSAEFITKNDMEQQRRRLNADAQRGTLLGKLDFQLAENVNLTLGGQYSGGKANNYSRTSTIFSPDNIGQSTSTTIRSYARFTQRFNNTDDSNRAIKNAFYSIQADYQKELNGSQDKNFGEDIFKYGYIGKFTEDVYPTYDIRIDSLTGNAVTYREAGKGVTTNARFERSELNPVLANYNTLLFTKYGIQPQSIFAGRNPIRGYNGLLNGDIPPSVYGIYPNVGSQITGFNKSNNDQLSVGIDATVEVQPKRNRHSLEFGLYYQQRTERSYGLTSALSSNNSLWERARLLTNAHLTQYDYSNPIYVVNGVRYTKEDYLAGRVNPAPGDTVIYNYLYVPSAQSAFDANLRERLGFSKSDTRLLNVDEIDPSLLSIDMFAPDELFNSGSSFVGYRGYDYTGKLQTGNVNWNDFFTQKDENGRFTRPIGAFRPNYIAGYLQDNFLVGKARFNLGVRVDRYDANTRVLKDPYSLYETRTVGQLNGDAIMYGPDGRPAPIPSNIGNDFTVYVANSAIRNPRIVGFRDGDTWYGTDGKIVEDPTSLKAFTGGSDPQVLQVRNAAGKVTDIKSTDYDPNSSFTDYTPQVNVMPRFSLVFPIQDQTMFYAHYNVIVQRPRFGVSASPLDYYFMADVTGQPIISNPNLKPEKAIDYEFGFQQAINRQSGITLSMFVKERRDQIQIRPYLYASPQTYYTFGNRDFSTTKGLRVKYDFRRRGPIQFLLSYTLQFAEGTGSSATSSNRGSSSSFQTDGLLSNYISAQLPNIRQTFALDYDARHNIALNIDYRYFDGVDGGPMIAGYRPFKNAGFNLIATAISGTPYTRYQDPVTTTIVGTVNGARLPWRLNLDLSIDKDIAIQKIGKKTSDETGLSGKRAPLVANVFMNIRNLLNTRQILGVYGYSQDPRDNGFLNSPLGQTAIANQTYAPSYVDLYNIYTDGPGNFSIPRMVNVGFRFNF